MPKLSLKNAGKRAPAWFRRTKKASLILTVAANAMVASWGFENELLTTRLQLWCTIGIGACLEAFEALLKDDGEDEIQLESAVDQNQ